MVRAAGSAPAALHGGALLRLRQGQIRLFVALAAISTARRVSITAATLTAVQAVVAAVVVSAGRPVVAVSAAAVAHAVVASAVAVEDNKKTTT